MKRSFVPNLDWKGRLARGVPGLALGAGAAWSFGTSPWLALGLAAASGFLLFEALRGWCALRACGWKTRL